MKRLTIAGIILSLSLLLSGCFAIEKYYQWKYAREREEIIQIVESEEVQNVFRKIITDKMPDAFSSNSTIQYIEVDYDSLKYTPAGGMNVRLYVNGNRELAIKGILIKNNKDAYELTVFIMSEELGEMFYGKTN